MGTVIAAGGLRAPDPELHELINPYHVLQYEFWPDSAGAGQWRGGMGTIYRWRVDADGIAAVNFGGGAYEETRPHGLVGGHNAPLSTVQVYRNGTAETIGPQTYFNLNQGDEVLIFETGGGGYGDPIKRDRQRLADDIADGLISHEQARAVYGAHDY
jgi:N-methylhydantoinase B